MTAFTGFAARMSERSTLVAAAAAATVTASLWYTNERNVDKSNLSNIHNHQPFRQFGSCRYTANESNNNLSSLVPQPIPLFATTTTTTTSTLSPASPTLPIRMIRPNPNLEIAFDVRTRTPIYAMEMLSCQSSSIGCQPQAQAQPKGKQQHTKPSRPPFYEDTSIHPPEYRSKLAHYRNSGWDRGHMAPAADFAANPQHRDSTFTLCNVAPQHHILNSTLWCALEVWVRGVVKRQCDETNSRGSDRNNNNSNTHQVPVVYVVTGPLWLPHRQVDDSTFEYRYSGLGRPPSLVAVPTHFFKVVVVVDTKTTNQIHDQYHHEQPTTTTTTTIQQFACFVVPNQPPTSKVLQHYIVSWTDLETVTGLMFFPQWATPQWKDRADYLTRRLQQQHGQTKEETKEDATSPKLLLLTDGSNHHRPTSTRTLWKRIKEAGITKHDELEHLCALGRCR
jgi:endonuclease G, mitochondrial